MIRVVGGGLAGCEAAWQAANFGHEVELYEMRPYKSGPAHHTGVLAELVCSNSLRGAALENAVGLLKEELFVLGSLVVGCARESAVPAGGALAVDRERFAALIEARLSGHPRVRIVRAEVDAIDAGQPTIVACGPLPSEALSRAIDALLETVPAQSPAQKRLHYFDAASPIVSTDSLDLGAMFRQSRYDKGDGDDYLNIPLDEAQYAGFVRDLCELPKAEAKAFEDERYFEGCLPIEVIAGRGVDALRFGPMKPVGLRDPRTGRRPFAVVQLRKENAAGTAYNLVGFQTQMTWPSQREAFGKLPGLGEAEWLRLGVMHRNAFLDAPRLLESDLRLRGSARTWFAGQITGAEGYVEAAACGAIAAISAVRYLEGREPLDVPSDTALGAVVAHLQNRASPDYQPANVTWSYFSDPPGPRIRDKRERRRRMAERALGKIEAWRGALHAPQLATIG